MYLCSISFGFPMIPWLYSLVSQAEAGKRKNYAQDLDFFLYLSYDDRVLSSAVRFSSRWFFWPRHTFLALAFVFLSGHTFFSPGRSIPERGVSVSVRHDRLAGPTEALKRNYIVVFMSTLQVSWNVNSS
ncbi:hypothetical protein KSP40_PGU018371 [Platanthera guangdongensis]|uniref:Uncharacterized protein n=1 Tax=Platanthera guangdongensis TaxID=2320717 RepID=A0ABR2MHV2_9ASPA